MSEREHVRDTLQEYYDRRAPEYEEKYFRNEPARQSEQTAMADAMREAFAWRNVLEVACGTGFWTEVVAQVARHVVATDTSAEMLTLAAKKGISPDKVDFQIADAYNLLAVPGEFDAAFANFWFSHVRKSDIEGFLSGLHGRLGPSALVFMCDDMRIPGVGGDFVEHAGDEDTYKRRQLRDGSTYTIVKNYFDGEGLRAIFGLYTDELHVEVGAYYWWVRYRVA